MWHLTSLWKHIYQWFLISQDELFVSPISKRAIQLSWFREPKTSELSVTSGHESAERMEAEKSPNVGKLRDVQEEVRNRDRQFSSLTSRGKDQLRAAGDTDIVLDSKVNLRAYNS